MVHQGGSKFVTEGPRPAASLALDYLEPHLRGGERATQAMKALRSGLQKVPLPAWNLPDDVGDIVQELADLFLDSLSAKASALGEFLSTPDLWFGAFQETLLDQVWPWGWPVRKEGIVYDVEDAWKLYQSAFNDLWRGGEKLLNCPNGKFLEGLAALLARATEAGVAGWGLLNTALSRLDLWVWVIGELIGSIVPLLGNAVAAGVVEQAQLILVASVVAQQVAEMVVAAVKIFEEVLLGTDDDAQDAAEKLADDEDALIEKYEEELAEDDPRTPEEAAAAEIDAIAEQQDPAENARADRLERLMDQVLDAAIVTTVAGVLALLGGAGASFGQKSVKRIKKIPRAKRKPKNKRKQKKEKINECPVTPARGKNGKVRMSPAMRKQCMSCGAVRGMKEKQKKRREDCSPCKKKRKKKRGQCFVTGTKVWGAGVIERLMVGNRVLTWLPGELGYREMGLEIVIVPSQWRVVRVRQEMGDQWMEADLLRPVTWMRENGIRHVGDGVILDMEEMGAEGLFQVVEIEACPEIVDGPGRVVLSVFRHGSGVVYDLWVEGEPLPIGVTGRHPIWSVDRRAWIAARDLRKGEQVRVADGVRTVMGWTARGNEPVYNIEVEGDHCYRIGEQGILVHNASSPCETKLICPPCNFFGDDFSTQRDGSIKPEDGKLYRQLDGLGRATGAKARLCYDNIDGGTPAGNDLVAGWDEATRILPGGRRANIVDRAHLIAQILGGSGDSRRNLVVTCARTTNAQMKTLEKAVRDFVTANKNFAVDYEVEVEYQGSSPYPSRIRQRAIAVDPESVRSGKPTCWGWTLDRWTNPIPGEIDILKCKGAPGTG